MVGGGLWPYGHAYVFLSDRFNDDCMLIMQANEAPGANLPFASGNRDVLSDARPFNTSDVVHPVQLIQDTVGLDCICTRKIRSHDSIAFCYDCFECIQYEKQVHLTRKALNGRVYGSHFPMRQTMEEVSLPSRLVSLVYCFRIAGFARCIVPV